MGPGWRVGRIGGIDIAIHPSWLVIFFLVTFSLAESVFPREFRGWSDALYWGIGAVTAVLFFGSVLVHELNHALLARRFGLKVEGITLFIFGGATTIDSESRTPREEALIALAGPVSSFVVGGILLGIGAVVDRLFAYLLIGFGVYLALGPGNIFGGLWLALIGWFLSTAAEATAAQAGIERSLRGVRVRDAMEPEPPSVSPNETVADLVQERMLRGEDRSFLVRHDDGGLAGLVTLTDVRRLAREQWPQARVTDVMTRYADLATIAPDAPLADALRIIQEREVGQLPVVEGGDGRNPVGVVTRR